MGKYTRGICQRSGAEVLLSQLVRDGQNPELLVLPEWADPYHPQLKIQPVDDNEGIVRNPSPESFLTTPPVLTVTPNEETGCLELTWTAGEIQSRMVSSYTVWRSVNGGAFQVLATLPVVRDWMGGITSEPLTYTDCDVTPGQSIQYEIFISDGVDTSSGSGASAAVVAPEPVPPAGLMVFSGSISGEIPFLFIDNELTITEGVASVGTGDSAVRIVGNPETGTWILQTTDSLAEDKLYRSTDGGETWTQVSGGLPSGLSLSGLQYSSAQNRWCAHYMDNGEIVQYYSTDDGISFFQGSPSNLEVNLLTFEFDGHFAVISGVLGTSEPDVFVENLGGNIWTELSQIPTTDFFSANSVDTSFVGSTEYVVLSGNNEGNAGIAYSTDLLTWTRRSMDPNEYFPVAFCSTFANGVWLFHTETGLYTTAGSANPSDIGESLTLLADPAPFRALSAAMRGIGIVFIGSDTGYEPYGIWACTDGTSWQSIGSTNILDIEVAGYSGD